VLQRPDFIVLQPAHRRSAQAKNRDKQEQAAADEEFYPGDGRLTDGSALQIIQEVKGVTSHKS
jgi:hypothetical protein